MKKLFLTIIVFLAVSFNCISQCNTAYIISQGHPAYASSQESAAYPPGNAFDGNRTTRWSSAFNDPQYLYVDLGAIYPLCQVDLIWETAYGKDFTIDISNDAATWTTVSTVTGNTALNNSLAITGSAQFVRMHGTARGTPNGYSLYGMHVFSTNPSPSCSPTDLALGGAATASSTESAAFPAFQAFDGSSSTRWSSIANVDPQYIFVDLGQKYNICNVSLTWETALGKDFDIDVSDDASTWTPVYAVTGNTSLTNSFAFAAAGRYVRMYGIARGTGYGYSLYEFTVHGTIILPIVLSGFKATVENHKTVLLNWTTEQEINNDHFDIERSIYDTSFTVVGKRLGKVNSSVATQYQWVDSFPTNGKNNYRLKQVDLDGNYSYSPVTSVDVINPDMLETAIYPNPVKDLLTVTIPVNEKLESLSIVNPTGSRLLKLPGNTSNNFSISVSTLLPGLYILVVRTNHQTRSFKLLKN